MVTLYLYGAFMLTDFVIDLQIKIYASYYLLGVMGLTAIVNAGVVIISMCLSAKQAIQALIKKCRTKNTPKEEPKNIIPVRAKKYVRKRRINRLEETAINQRNESELHIHPKLREEIKVESFHEDNTQNQSQKRTSHNNSTNQSNKVVRYKRKKIVFNQEDIEQNSTSQKKKQTTNLKQVKKMILDFD